MALELNDSIFEEKVLKSDKPVLVDFWAEWCGPCRMVGPIIDELSKDFEGKAVVGKIDVDAEHGLPLLSKFCVNPPASLTHDVLPAFSFSLLLQ